MFRPGGPCQLLTECVARCSPVQLTRLERKGKLITCQESNPRPTLFRGVSSIKPLIPAATIRPSSPYDWPRVGCHAAADLIMSIDYHAKCVSIVYPSLAKFDDIRPNSRLLQSQSIYLDFDYERSGSRTGAGQRQTDSFPNSECFLGGGPFPEEGDILPQRSGRR